MRTRLTRADARQSARHPLLTNTTAIAASPSRCSPDFYRETTTNRCESCEEQSGRRILGTLLFGLVVVIMLATCLGMFFAGVNRWYKTNASIAFQNYGELGA